MACLTEQSRCLQEKTGCTMLESEFQLEILSKILPKLDSGQMYWIP